MPRNIPPRRPGKPSRPSAGPRGSKPPMRGKRPPAARPQRPSKSPVDDADEADDDATPGAAKPQREGERLQKVLAAAGLASRRECELLITEGRVEVDGETVTELGAKVDRDRQEIRVDGEPLSRPKHVYYAVHKPTGVVTTARDPSGRPRVIDLLPPSVGRVFTVGRLDLASEGLILLTNDGDLANQLTHPKHGVEKTYEVQVAGQMENDVLATLKHGVHLSEGYAHAVHARIKARLKRSTLLEMVLDEGRNREVRRLLARVGHKVQRLVRVAVGPIRLGDMPRGAHRRLTQEEVKKLREAAAAGPKPKTDEDRPPRPAGRPFVKRPYPPKFTSGKAAAGKPASGRGAAAKPTGGRAMARKTESSQGAGRPASGRPAAGRPVGGRPPAGKPIGRKPPTARKPAGGAVVDRAEMRKVIGEPVEGAPAGGQPPARKPPVSRPASGRPASGRPTGGRAGGGRPAGGRPAGGKAKFRSSTGAKPEGRKPAKRGRRPERPQRGGENS